MARFKTFALMTLLLCSACGGGDEDDFTCAQSDRHGTYYLDMETLSGNCGEMADGLVSFDASGSGSSACQNLDAPKWSEGSCKVETHISCDLGDGLTFAEARTITTQEDEDGAVLSGTMTMSVSGSQSCTGSYRVTFTRQ